MKTFRKSYVPDSIEYNGKKYVRDREVVNALDETPQPGSIKVIVTNPRLRGKSDLHGKPYPSSTHYFIPYETPDEKKAREEREAKDREHVKFWVSMFSPRTKKWCRDKMRELKNQTVNSMTESVDEPNRKWNQIEALKQVLSN